MTKAEHVGLHWAIATCLYLLARDANGYMRVVFYSFMILHLTLMAAYLLGWIK